MMMITKLIRIRSLILLNMNGYSDGILNIVAMGKISLLKVSEINVPSEILRSLASYAMI